MTDPQAPQDSPLPTGGDTPDSRRNIVLIAYITYAVAILFGIACLVGLIILYIKRSELAGSIWESHATYLIRTFWIGLVASLVAGLLLFVGIGALVMIAVAIWYIYRVVKGFLAFNDNRPIAAPESFL